MPGGPEVLCVDALERQKAKTIFSRECSQVVRGESHTAPGIGDDIVRQAVELPTKDAARLQDAPRFAHVGEDHIAAGDVLEHGIGVYEIE